MPQPERGIASSACWKQLRISYSWRPQWTGPSESEKIFKVNNIVNIKLYVLDRVKVWRINPPKAVQRPVDPLLLNFVLRHLVSEHLDMRVLNCWPDSLPFEPSLHRTVEPFREVWHLRSKKMSFIWLEGGDKRKESDGSTNHRLCQFLRWRPPPSGNPWRSSPCKVPPAKSIFVKKICWPQDENIFGK